MQEDFDAFLKKALDNLPTEFPVVAQPEQSPVDPVWVIRLNRARAARQRYAEIRARHVVPEAANDDAPRHPCPAPLSKKSNSRIARPRRSQARDRRNLTALEGFVPDVRPVIRDRARDTLVGEPPSPSPSVPTLPEKPSRSPSKSTAKRQAADQSDRRKAPAWRYTTEIIRGHACIRTVSTRGAGLSWTLNLGGKVRQAVNDNATRALGELQDRLAKALQAEFGEPRDFLFVPETTTAGRLHLHGAVDAFEDERERVEAILARIGGGWDATRGREHQAHTDVLWGPDGWLRYSVKSMAATKRHLGLSSVLRVTRGCRARAEELWERSRAKVR